MDTFIDAALMSQLGFTLLSLSVLILPLAMAAGCGGGNAAGDEESAGADENTSAGQSPSQKGDGHTTPPQHANHLAGESSLYLLQHAHNPVDWYPWGEEALSRAREENKLIFLSIGYSSCHWCHVMERESFEDEEVADKLNEHFVCIKVDREERPDIDEIYMTALQIYFRLIGSGQGGGWPLTMFLTPEGKPVAGGTYFPARDRGGYRGLMTVLDTVQTAWKKNPDGMRENAEAIGKLVRRQLEEQSQGTAPLKPELVRNVLRELQEQFDPEYGGFGYSSVNPQIPKFPTPSNLFFLLDRVQRSGGDAQEEGEEAAGQARKMLVTTLEKMAAGGIRDHLGGGFHRYSTDRFWAVPHFEKMLYDNGQLASVYAEAYGLTGREDFRRVVEELVAFILREMTGPQGQFYSSVDAETDGEEGVFYVWQYDELARLLGPDELDLFSDVYAINKGGNFEGSNVILLRRPLSETAKRRGLSEQQLRKQLAPLKQKLLEARSRRERPATDEKVLTSWSGLMIGGLADAGRILEEPEYVEAAERSARFVLGELRAENGRLLRTFGKGRAQLNAYLDDYAFLAGGLCALRRATGDREWLDEARRLTDKQLGLFWDDAEGGFYFTSDDHETPLARSKSPADSALPSGQAVSAANLIYLSRELDRPEYMERAERTISTFAPLLREVPGGMTQMAVSLAAYLDAGAPAGTR